LSIAAVAGIHELDRHLYRGARRVTFTSRSRRRRVEHDPETWLPVFGSDHARI